MGRGPIASNRGGGPNILFVVLDTLTASAAAIGKAGEPTRMPRLTGLAEQGLSFEHAVSNAPWTYPAHASMFTGQLPSQHGMETGRQFSVWDQDVKAGRTGIFEPGHPGPKTEGALAERWLPAMLARAGYETVCASNNPWVGRLTQMDHGFGLIRDTLSVRLAPRRGMLTRFPRLRSYARAGYYAERAVRGQGDLLGRDALDRIHEWLAGRDAERPFFLFVNLIEAHAPYLTPQAAQAVRAAGGGAASAMRAMLLTEARQTIGYNLSGSEPSRRDRRAVAVQRSLHEHAASYLDGLLGELLDACRQDRRGLVAAVTSDHGESFGEHGMLLHGFTLDEPALHVPLVVSGDGVPARTHAATADIRRLHPTLLEVAGLAPPDDRARSLLDPGHERGPVVAERDAMELPFVADAAPRRLLEATGRIRTVWQDPWKLVVTAVGPSLFDLAGDPGELQDVAGRHPDVVAGLTAALPPWPDRDDSALANTTRPDPSGLTAAEEARIAEQLAALGYLE